MKGSLVLGAAVLVVAATVTPTMQATAAPSPTATPSAATLAAESAQQLVAGRAAELHISPGDAVVQRPVISTPDGLQYVGYDRTYQGLPVYGGDFVVVTDKAGTVLSTGVGQTQAIGLASLTPTLSSSRAQQIARGRNAAGTVESASTSRLVVYALDGPARLAWENVSTGQIGPRPTRVRTLVDATSGKVLDSYDEVMDGTGNAAINGGTVTIQTSRSGSGFAMSDPTRPGINCRSEITRAILTGADDVWGNGNGTSIETGCVDALYSVQHEWDMLASWLGRNGINGRGSGFPVFVGLNQVNAFWNGSQVHIGHNRSGAWASSMDVVGHEYGHGIDQTTPGGFSASGVSEATGDIFGTLTEFFTNNPFDPPDYSMGEEVNLVGNGPIRQMFNPSLVGDPNCYSNAIPTMETHDAAGPFDHWFVLASKGSAASAGQPASPTCNGQVVTSTLGPRTVGRIFYNAMLTKTTRMTYLRYRTATLNAAKNLFPGDCGPFNIVRAAWNAVSVPPQAADPTC